METATQDVLQSPLPDVTTGSRKLLADIVEALDGEGSAFAGAVELADEHHAAGRNIGELARELARLCRLVEVRLAGRCDAERLRTVLDDATARSLEAFTQVTRGRRERWLSYHTHEMRNALNTLVNAHWLLRNGEGKSTARVFDMAERAVRRLEAAIKEVRELETQSMQGPAPGRPDKV